MNWKPIKSAPMRTNIIAYWSKSGHCEDATLHIGDDGMITHVLFDGERLSDEPTHWMPIPEPPQPKRIHGNE